MNEVRAAYFGGHYADALRLAEALQDRAVAARNLTYEYHALNVMANSHAMIGSYEEALWLFNECFRLTAQPDLAMYHSNTYANLGAVHIRMENWPKALEYTLQARELLPTCTHTRRALNLINIYDNLSFIYYSLDHAEAAKQAALDGIAACESEGIPIANSQYMMLGRAYYLAGEYDEALTYLEQALHSDTGMHGDHWRGLICMYVSDVYRARGALAEAEARLHEALDLFTQHWLQADLIQVHERLHSLYKSSGDFARALHHHEQMHHFKERIFNAQSDARLKTLQSSHELEKARLEREAAMQHSANLLHELDSRERLIADLDNYARSVAHDLINPITAISGASDLLLMEFEVETYPPRLTRMANVIQSASAKALQIIHTLLEVARVQRAEMGTRPVDMVAVIDEALARLSGMIESAEAQVTRTAVLPAAMGDARWLEEVFANLISNAVKYGGTPPIVQIDSFIPEPGCVAFRVRDNGDGILPEEQSRLFASYVRLDRHVTTVPGHGLGLHIVRTILEKLNGHVHIESTGLPGQGATLVVVLPAASP